MGPERPERRPQSPALRQPVIDQFHRLYSPLWRVDLGAMFYRGMTTWKCPLDLWIYQEILHEVRPAG